MRRCRRGVFRGPAGAAVPRGLRPSSLPAPRPPSPPVRPPHCPPLLVCPSLSHSQFPSSRPHVVAPALPALPAPACGRPPAAQDGGGRGREAHVLFVRVPRQHKCHPRSLSQFAFIASAAQKQFFRNKKVSTSKANQFRASGAATKGAGPAPAPPPPCLSLHDACRYGVGAPLRAPHIKPGTWGGEGAVRHGRRGGQTGERREQDLPPRDTLRPGPPAAPRPSARRRGLGTSCHRPVCAPRG